jgi:uncharacterized protein YecE (DUF72 family)
MVGLKDACRRSSWTTLASVPSDLIKVENVCRKVCQPIVLVMPTRLATARSILTLRRSGADMSRTGPDFQFSCKLTEVFTHAPGREKKKSSTAETIKYTQQDIDEAKRGFEPIMHVDKLDALLLQFPISFRHTEGNWDHLIDVIHLFREFPLALEVRHKSWGDPLILNALREERVWFCNIDVTRIGDTLEGTEIVTSPLAYFRLHGRSKQWFTAKNRDERYDYLYSKSSLEKLKRRWRRQRIKRRKHLSRRITTTKDKRL